jgi:hypothetical protein
MADDEAAKHEKYFLTQKDIEDKTRSVNVYENMKKVHDYDQIMADKHPENRKLHDQAERSGKQADTYYGNKISGFVYFTDKENFHEADRQGRTRVEPGPLEERDAIKLAQRAEKLHGDGRRYGSLENTTIDDRGMTDDKGNPVLQDHATGKDIKPADIEQLRMQNNREATLEGIRDDKAKQGPVHAPAAHHGR